MWLADLPRPQVGLRVIGGSGQVYYADFGWPERRVLGEADGWSKYGTRTSEFRARLAAERWRQQDLEERGWRFVRWGSDERLADVVRRLRRALA